MIKINLLNEETKKYLANKAEKKVTSNKVKEPKSNYKLVLITFIIIFLTISIIAIIFLKKSLTTQPNTTTTLTKDSISLPEPPTVEIDSSKKEELVNLQNKRDEKTFVEERITSTKEKTISSQKQRKRTQRKNKISKVAKRSVSLPNLKKFIAYEHYNPLTLLTTLKTSNLSNISFLTISGPLTGYIELKNNDYSLVNILSSANISVNSRENHKKFDIILPKKNINIEFLDASEYIKIKQQIIQYLKEFKNAHIYENYSTVKYEKVAYFVKIKGNSNLEQLIQLIEKILQLYKGIGITNLTYKDGKFTITLSLYFN